MIDDVRGDGVKRKPSTPELVHMDDVRALLAALGLGTHARPYSCHDVVHRDVLPEIRRLRALLDDAGVVR